MKNGRSVSKPWLLLALAGCTTLGLWPSIARAQKFEINPLAEKKINELPAGPLYQPSEELTLFCKSTAAVILFCLTELIREIGDGRGGRATAGFRGG